MSRLRSLAALDDAPVAPHAGIIADLPLNDLTVKAVARRLGIAGRYCASIGPAKARLDREWLSRVVARLGAGESRMSIGVDAAPNPDAFDRKFKRITGLTVGQFRRAHDILTILSVVVEASR